MTHNFYAPLKIVAMLVTLLPSFIFGQITWPQGQLLPTFPATASHQDLFFMNGSSPVNERSWRWEAEGSSMGHKTGRAESDGWLCQSGIDAPGEHMLYGPYDNTVTAGQNVAEFRMKTDNNTANNDVIADIDVRNSTTGATLAAQTVTRQQFSVAGNYVSFKLPFVMPADNQVLELRVHWKGGAYLKVDYVGVQQNNGTAENYLFASLKGLVNKTQPRLFSYDGDAFAEGPYTWLQSLGLTWTEHSDRWALITKYKSEISGLIVYDPAQPHTVNLATMLAKNKNALIASPSLLARLTAAPYNFPIVQDLRGQFTSKLQVYQTLYNTYWPSMDKRILLGLSPDAHQGSLREYASAVGAAVIWLDPQVAGESELLNSFLSSMPPGANFMGWWPEEGAGVTRASQYGISTIASDYTSNLTVHSGMPRTVNIKPTPPKPALQNKIYVAFILSDGDNLQYVEHLMRKLWNNPDRGSVPIGWTVSPAMLDAMPGALNYYHQTSTNNDNLISGPSGYGYAYPNNFPNQAALDQFVAKTEDYNRRSGLRVVTIWNTITGGINPNVGQSFAVNAPSTLGLTGQNTGGPLSIYNNSLPGMPLSCNYCTGEQAMKDHIASASNGWNGAEPRFVIIQAQPWTDVKPSNFKNVANSLNGNYVVVRPDHLFQLLRESKGLPIDPMPLSTTGLVTAYKDCNYTGFSAGLDVGDYTLSNLQGKGVMNNDISSLKITQGYKAILYDGDNFTGATTEITADMGCSADWNDRVSSMRIRTNGDQSLSGIYLLQNRNSSLSLDVNGGVTATADGVGLIQSGLNENTNQQFRFEHLGDGTYKVTAVHSGKVLDVDGIKKENGVKVQQWTYFGTPNQQFIAVPTGDGYFKLVAKHSGRIVEVAGASTAAGANVQQWDNNNQTCGMWKLNRLTTNGTGDGLTGNYFNGMNFETPVNNRKDATISFDWGGGTPNAAVNADLFSARWSGQIQPRYSGEYTFHLNSDNGRRLWINNTLIVDKWVDDWGTEYTGKITLVAGQRYDIKLEYFENVGGANIKFEWSSASQTREVVPQSQLYSNALPTVSISSPANNASFTAPASINITANASDNINVAKVEFYNGATKLGEDVTTPYSFAWTGVAVGSYAITARATDNLGGIAVSSAVNVTVTTVVGNNPPTISLTAPTNNQTYNAPASVTISANAADGDGTIAKVEFYNGATKIGDDASLPYSFVWANVAAGTYTITAKATDDKGASTTSTAVSITVKSVVTNVPPTISLTAPTNNQSYTAPASVTISANAADGDGTISKVEFYNGATKVGEDLTTPYSFVWANVAAGTYSITAKATDNGGAATTSTAVTITVIAPNVLPTITLTAPTNNQAYNAPASVTISATAGDADGTVSKVEFYNGATKVGEDASSPYSFVWTNVAAGTYTISAKAIDNKNASTNSSSVSIKVNTVVTDACATVAQYAENNGYVAGSAVKNAGRRYECKEWPYSGWCNGAGWAYAPGTGAYWQDAWYDRGSCNARVASDAATELLNESTMLSPNPVQDELNIRAPFDLTSATFTVVDMHGTTVYHSVASESINTTDFEAGIYSLIVITSENQKVVKKFVKIK